jgi:hypothetical protein
MDTENSDLGKTIAEEPDQILEDMTQEEMSAFKLNDKGARVQKGSPEVDRELLDLLGRFGDVENDETRNEILADVEEVFSNPTIRRNIGLRECRKAAEVLMDIFEENDGLVAAAGRSMRGLLVQFETTIRQSVAGQFGGKIKKAREMARQAMAAKNVQDEQVAAE